MAKGSRGPKAKLSDMTSQFAAIGDEYLKISGRLSRLRKKPPRKKAIPQRLKPKLNCGTYLGHDRSRAMTLRAPQFRFMQPVSAGQGSETRARRFRELDGGVASERAERTPKLSEFLPAPEWNE
jgi:hypothetical protein